MQQLRQLSFGSCSELGLTGDFRGEFPLDVPNNISTSAGFTK